MAILTVLSRVQRQGKVTTLPLIVPVGARNIVIKPILNQLTLQDTTFIWSFSLEVGNDIDGWQMIGGSLSILGDTKIDLSDPNQLPELGIDIHTYVGKQIRIVVDTNKRTAYSCEMELT